MGEDDAAVHTLRNSSTKRARCDESESLVKRVRITSKRATNDVETSRVPKDLPKLHLGETGRMRLKSMISSMIRDDEELRSQV
jgi:hypothetical protein